MNEELQSSNEALETSKEELQSLNEELSTVNAQLEEKLRQLEQANGDLNNLLSSTNIAMLFLDRQFRIKRFTPALTRLFNVIPSDINRPITDIASRFADHDLLEYARAVLEQLVPNEREIHLDDGQAYLCRIQPYRTQEDYIDGVVLTFTDITALHRASQRVERLATVVTDSNDAITVFDLTGRYVSWNRAAERIYGYSEVEALKMNATALLPEHELPRHEEFMRKIRNNEPTPSSVEMQRLTKHGAVLDVWVTLSVLHDDANNAITVATTERDNTAQRRIEQELRARSEKLMEADHRKDEFLAMLAHELRNPLAPIRNAVEALRRTFSEEEALHTARDVIDRQVQHLSHLINDLLDAARITQGQVALRRRPVALSTIVERGIELNRPLIDLRGHKLSINLPPRPVWLEGDATRLAQVLGNLLNNAAKYTTDKGAITVSAEVEGDQVVLCVRDSGIGIPADLLPHIFDLFTQGDRSLDRSQGGLGIGLTLVRQLVELHGGSVMAASAGPGQGSQFEVRLPLALSQVMPASVHIAPEPATVSSARPRRVLLVDDNTDTVESMAALLDIEGHDVRTATHAATAIELAETFRPHAVVLDIGLPVMDGYEVARRLRQLPHMDKALLLAVTGYDKPEDRRRSKEAGFDYHLVKPVDPVAILALLVADRSDEPSTTA